MGGPYSQAVAPLVAILVLLVFAAAAALWGHDSRPGFDGQGDRVKERWFVHSRDEY